MRTKPFRFLLALALLTPISAKAVTNDDLRPDAPACEMTKGKRPRLPVDSKNDVVSEVVADLNGDGWCDYALGVPYPANSNMNAYTLDQLMLLGGVEWR